MYPHPRAVLSAPLALIALMSMALAQQAPAPTAPGSPPVANADTNQQPRGAGRAAMDACRSDIATLCAGVPGGGGKRLACLAENRTKLSDPCQSAIRAVLDKRAVKTMGLGAAAAPSNPASASPEMSSACQADIASICSGVEKGQIKRCLTQNRPKLSPTCSSTIDARRLQQQAMVAVCRDDTNKLCGDAKGHQMMQCLRTNAASLSRNCVDAIAALR